jgi:catechol 2,3-dioxygenase-like lactoylglutathione lyase family enzyme
VRPHVSVITLGVSDLTRAKEFYGAGLGWPAHAEEGEWICYLLGGGASALALYPWDALGADAHVDPEGSGFRGLTLSYVVRAQDRVDAVLAEAEAAGAEIVKQPAPTDWGGYSGYFADPDGYPWEIASGATQLPFAE